MDILSIERIWEDSDFFQIKLKAQSELICASIKSYTTASLINELCSKLSTFPKTFEDRYIWENGTKGDTSTPFVSLEFWCEDKLGHIVIEIYMELDDGASYSKHNCCFYVKTEIGQLYNFSKALAKLNECGTGQKAWLNKFDVN